MRRTGRQRSMVGRLAFDFQPAGQVTATANAALATDNSGKRRELTMTTGGAVVSAGNLSASGSGQPLGRYSGLAGVFTGDRYYFGPQIDPEIVINAGEDFTISALVVSYFGSGNRAFFVGTPISGGGNGTVAMGMQSGGARQIALAPGTGSGTNLSWTGPTIQTGVLLRYDLCRVNGLCFAFFDGQPASGGSGFPAASSGNYVQGGRLSVGGVGEYTGGGNGGTYGERWSGTVEKLVILKGVGLYTAAFNPFDPRPFRLGKLRR